MKMKMNRYQPPLMQRVLLLGPAVNLSSKLIPSRFVHRRCATSVHPLLQLLAGATNGCLAPL